MFYSPTRNVTVLRLRGVIWEKHVVCPVGANFIEQGAWKSWSGSAEKRCSPASIESDSSVPWSQKLTSETYTQSIRTVIKIHFNNILSSAPDVLECRNDFTRRKQIDKLINW
jgi:hypothetical protein